MDINPLIMDEKEIVAVDARVRVDYPKPSTDRYHHLAIHPYPAPLVHTIQLNDGTDITIRPIRPEDAEIEQKFVSELSNETKYFRFMNYLQELSQEMLVRFTQIDYYNEMALIAVTSDGSDEEQSTDAGMVAGTKAEDESRVEEQTGGGGGGAGAAGEPCADDCGRSCP